MVEFEVKKDIRLLALQATNFPEGVAATFDKIYAQTPKADTRKCFGIFSDKNGKIKYWAALEELSEKETEVLKMETYIIHSGKYLSIKLKHWKEDLSTIGKAFHKMLENEKVDPTSDSIEMYNEDGSLTCLLKLKTVFQ